MKQSLRHLMTGLVDYAGLFPPASLEVAAAVAEYAAHRGEAEAWMLGRFIAPAARLDSISSAMDGVRPADAVWPFSVLVGAGDDAARARAAVPVQGAAIKTFEGSGGGRTPVESLETPVPVEAARTDPAAFLDSLATELIAAGLTGRELFCETPAGGDDARVITAIGGLAAAQPPLARIGAKLRCGGVTAEAFPAAGRIADVIVLCRDHGVPLKATAGLHHPVRRRSSDPDVMMHGFLNVFGAGLLAWGTDASRESLVACLEETDPAAFSLDGDAFTWGGLSVPAPRVAEIRRAWLCGFGSCSFAEPRADLDTLGLL